MARRKTIEEADYRESISSMSKEEFERHFINKSIEPVAGKIYDIFYSGCELGDSFNLIQELYWNLIGKLGEAVSFAKLMKTLRDQDWLRENFGMYNADDTDMIAKAMDELFVEKIAQVTSAADRIQFTEIMDEKVHAAFSQISFELNTLPSQHEVEFNDNGKIFSMDIDLLEFQLKGARDVLSTRFETSRESNIERVLFEVIGADITLNNTVYRDVYECLSILNLIPDEVRESHNKTSSRYVKENYIKAKYKRLGFPRDTKSLELM